MIDFIVRSYLCGWLLSIVVPNGPRGHRAVFVVVVVLPSIIIIISIIIGILINVIPSILFKIVTCLY